MVSKAFAVAFTLYGIYVSTLLTILWTYDDGDGINVYLKTIGVPGILIIRSNKKNTYRNA